MLWCGAIKHYYTVKEGDMKNYCRSNFNLEADDLCIDCLKNQSTVRLLIT